MGGQAFTHPGPNGEPALNTPRMSADIYSLLRSHYAAILESFYEDVATPAEGPGKVDFGDIDFTVSSPIARCDNSTRNGTDSKLKDLLSAAFNAQRAIHDSPTTSSFAIPIPDAANTATGKDEPTIYAQIDVHVCPADLFSWTVFHKSYADLWQILGLMVRPHGLTVTHEGVFARIPEIEATSPRSSFLFLTRDPATTMAFLGLDATAYHIGFRTEEEVFKWIGGCRLFSRAAFEQLRKASDRTRARKRAMYRRFLDEWLVTPAAEELLHEPLDRQAVFQDALAYFDVYDEYRRMATEFAAEQKEKELWRAILEAVPLQGDKLNLTVRGLRRWVRFESSSEDLDGPAVPVVADAPEMDCTKQAIWTADGRRDISELLAWVQENWEEVKIKERAREKRDAETRKREREAAKETPSTAEA